MAPSPLQDRLLKLLGDNIYMTLATQSEGMPWAAPVYYAFDPEFRIYFVSPVDTRHSQDIRENGRVSIAIFDSTAPPGEGDGIQIEATATELSGTEVLHASLVLFSRRFMNPVKRANYLDSVKYLGPAKLRLYRVDPIRWYLVDLDAPLDRRIEVEMS